MSKDSDPKMWVYPEHTKAKHGILVRYLGGWFPIMAKYNKRILVLDGFAGRGRYNESQEGSPLLALSTLLDHHYFSQMGGTEFVFMFVEADRDNAASLRAAVDEFMAERAPWPQNVKVSIINAEFEAQATSMIEDLRSAKKALAPTFAFVDPFGYSGLSMRLLVELLSYPRTELFVNFMVGHVMRFTTRDGQENAISGLFGLPYEEVVSALDDADGRVAALHKLYARQLHDVAGFDHVNSFKLKNTTGNVGYYLLHGTKHVQGVKVMKDAMWKLDPAGGYTFSNRLAGADVLFEPEPDLRPLSEAMARELAGRQRVSIEQLEEFALLETPYRDAHVRKALKVLESEGRVTVDRSSGRKGTFPRERTWVTFP